jgi:hypothetical protein
MARRVHRRLDIAQVSILAIAVLAVAMIAGCRHKAGSRTPPPTNAAAQTNASAEGQPDTGERVELSGIEIPFHSTSRDIEGVIRARSAEGDLKAGTGSLKNVTMEARERGFIVAAARAGAARVASGSQEVRFVAGVVFELRKDNASVRADQISWNWQTGEYAGSGNVELRTGDAVGRGSKIAGNTRTGKVSLRD